MRIVVLHADRRCISKPPRKRIIKKKARQFSCLNGSNTPAIFVKRSLVAYRPVETYVRSSAIRSVAAGIYAIFYEIVGRDVANR